MGSGKPLLDREGSLCTPLLQEVPKQYLSAVKNLILENYWIPDLLTCLRCRMVAKVYLTNDMALN